MKRVNVFLALGTVAAVAACGDGSGGGTSDGTSSAPSLQELSEIRVTLSSMDSLAVDLVDGGATTPDGARVTLLAAYSAQGDFDADGRDETAVLVVAEPGGTGVFLNLLAFRAGPDGAPLQVGDRLLGDRQEIHRFESVSDSLLVEITTQGPDDPVCCPTRRAQQIWLLRDGVWRLWRDNTLSAAPPDIQDGVERRDSTLAQPGPVRSRASAASDR